MNIIFKFRLSVEVLDNLWTLSRRDELEKLYKIKVEKLNLYCEVIYLT